MTGPPRIDLAHEPAFVLDRLTVRPSKREVTRDDGVVDVLEPRVMQVLVALRRANGAILSRDDLTRCCWEGRVVGEDAINRVISRLRRTAEGIGEASFQIETVTKVGYRLRLASGAPLDRVDDGQPPVQRIAGDRATLLSQRPLAIAAGGLLLLIAAAGAWLWLRPAPAAAHSMIVRLGEFRLAADLPATMPDTINAEVIAAFNVDGVIGVTSAPVPATGMKPAYSLGGTLYRVGDVIRVITRFTNERTGTVLWSDSIDYAADRVSVIPHKIAVDAGTIIRCGLSGAATYRKPLPDPVMSNYMQYCQEYWSYGGSKTLHFAKRVVAAVPDFSWGWSAVGNGFMQAADAEHDAQRATAMRAAGRRAEDQALALDRNNSDALAHKAYLIDQRDWIGQEALFRRAIAAKPLDCGCEHFGYGLKLQSVGRLRAAVAQFRAATDMLALWPDSQLALAYALVATEHHEQAKPYFDTAFDLSKDPNLGKKVAVEAGIETGDHAAAMSALERPQSQIPEESRAALLSAYQALAQGNAQAKLKAVRALLALPKEKQGEPVGPMLATLGATHEALQVAAEKPWLFWRRSMRAVLDQPGFPAIANQLGLMEYWRVSRTKPDVCLTKAAPNFCRMI